MNADFTDIGFADIGIVDLDLAKTTWSRVHSAMRTLYLGLSRAPDLAWTRFFHEERESRVVIKRHGLWIEDGFIVFDCLLPDVERHHLPDFRLSIAYANRKSRELLTQQEAHSQRQRHETHREQRRLAQLRAHILGIEQAAGHVPPESDSALPAQLLQAQPESAQALPQPQPYGQPPPPATAANDSVDHRSDQHDNALLDAAATTIIAVDSVQPEVPAGEGGTLDSGGASIPAGETAAATEQSTADQTAAPAESAMPPPMRDEFDEKRNEWRARFRAALTTSKESGRGND